MEAFAGGAKTEGAEDGAGKLVAVWLELGVALAPAGRIGASGPAALLLGKGGMVVLVISSAMLCDSPCGSPASEARGGGGVDICMVVSEP